MAPVTEKRSEVRRLFRKQISFQVSATKAGPSRNVGRTGLCVDISSGGIGLVTDCRFQRGEILKLFLPIGSEEVIAPVFAEVIWSGPSGSNTISGLKFLK
jgi:hypothetical protein